MIYHLFIKELRVDKGAIRIKKGHPKARGAGYFMMNRGVTNLIVVVSDEKISKVKDILSIQVQDEQQG